jgi:superfamily II DNA or RNA helicase
MQSATGSGKTIMATKILQDANEKGSTTWFVVPRRELVKQTAGTYDDFALPYSYVAAGNPFRAMMDNQICSLQTLPRRIDGLRPPKLAVIDECHYGAGYMDTLIEWLSAAGSYIIGLSATPKRMNGEGMGRWFDDMVLGPTIKELIAAKRLSEFKMFAPSDNGFTGVKTTAGDYNKGALQEWFDENGDVAIGDCVSTYKKHALGKIGLTFCSSIIESKKTAMAYCQAGIPACHLDGTMSADSRFEVINRLANREILQITSVDIMTFGFDLSAQVGKDITVECMSDLAPTKSDPKQLQKWGRALRKKDMPALIFDHVGNAYRHGMPDADREWSLDSKPKRRRSEGERQSPVRQCTKCYFCHDPAPVCPNCGHVYPVKSREIKQVDGELEEIKEIERQEKKSKRMEVGMAKSYQDLKRIGEERGYSKGWAYVMAKKKGLL